MGLSDEMEIRHTSTLGAGAPANPAACMRVAGAFRFRISVDLEPSLLNGEDGDADMQHKLADERGVEEKKEGERKGRGHVTKTCVRGLVSHRQR